MKYKIRRKVEEDMINQSVLYHIALVVDFENSQSSIRAFSGNMTSFCLNKHLLHQAAKELCANPSLARIASHEVFVKRKDFLQRLTKSLSDFDWEEIVSKAGIRLLDGCIYLELTSQTDVDLQKRLCNTLILEMEKEIEESLKELEKTVASLEQKHEFLKSWLLK